MTSTAKTRVENGTPSDGEWRNVMLQPGQVVGDATDCRWRVVAHLAEGGFSSVYSAEPVGPETSAAHGSELRALKVLWGTPAEVTAIGGEAEKMRAVSGHDNVLGLITSFRFERSTPGPGHLVALVLELAAEDLPRFGGRVQPAETAWAAVFEQVAAGLEHIHARRVVHGDIKPTNLLRVGARFTVADFGVSAPLESTRSAGIGWARTIAFWPPESASQGEVDAEGVRRPPAEGWRATQMGDVWALAVTMHRLLTGRHITPGTTPEQQYELVVLGRYAIDDRLGEGWRRLLGDCLAHDPNARTVTTAADLRRRLAELALGEDWDGVPWPPGAPRVLATLDLNPATATGSGPVVGTDPHSTSAATVEGSAEALVLWQTQEGGRVAGALMPGGLLLSATRHLTTVAVPALAQQVRDSRRAVVRFVEQRERDRAAGEGDEDVARTIHVAAAEVEATRQLSIAVADVTRQRDRAVQDRDRLARHRDDLAIERDRLRRDYAQLAGRLDRLEREQHEQQQRMYRPADRTRVFPQPAVRPTPPQPQPIQPTRAMPRPEPEAPPRPYVAPEPTPPAPPPAPEPAPRRRRSSGGGVAGAGIKLLLSPFRLIGWILNVIRRIVMWGTLLILIAVLGTIAAVAFSGRDLLPTLTDIVQSIGNTIGVS